MKPRLISIVFLFFCSVWCHAASQPIVLLDESFNGENSLSRWVPTSAQEGRIQLVPSAADAADLEVRMDDSVDNGTFSENILSRQVVIPELEALTIEFDFEAPNEERHDATLAIENPFDGIVVRSSGGGISVLSASSFRHGRNIIDLTQDFSLADLDQGNTLTIELHQYDNFSHPYDGITWDNIKLNGRTRQLLFAEPPFAISESDATFVLPVVYFPASDIDTVLTLQSANSPHTQYGSAIFPAGQEVAFLIFPGFDDSTLDGMQTYLLRVTDGVSISEPFTLSVNDDERAGLSLNVPAAIDELGGALTGSVSAANFSSASRPFSVQLSSSHPEVLSVPSSVVFTTPFGASSQSFFLTPAVNPRVIGDQVVTITASFGDESASQNVLIREGNSREPRIVAPTDILEGTTGVLARVELNGIFDSNIVVSLTSSSPRVIVAPTELVVAGGQQSASFTLTAPEDSVDQGNIPVTLTAAVEGAAPTTFQLSAIDNDISGFQVILPEFVQRGRAYAATIRAVNRDGAPVSSYAGSADVILYDTRTATELETLSSGLGFSNGSASVSLTFPVGGSGNSLLVRGADGSESVIGPFRFFHKIAFAANDIAADPNSGKIHAVSGTTAISGHLNSLTTIDPADGSLASPVFLGNEPAVLAITDDSRYAYAGLRGSYRIAKIDLTDRTVASTFVLNSGSVWSEDSFIPTQILTLPGRPDDIIVSQSHVGSSYAAVHAYFNGVFQPAGQSHDEWSMVRGAAADEFFGYNYTDTGYALHHCRLTATGFQTIKKTDSFSGSPFSGFGTRLAGGNNLLVASYGRVVDGSNFAIRGDIRLPWGGGSAPAHAVDLDTSRVIFAAGNEVAIFDTHAFSLIARFQIPDIGGIQEVARYGASGLAFRTANSEIVFVDDRTLIPSGEPVDLNVRISSDVEEATLNMPHRYTLEVTNSGANTATDVTLRLILNDGQRFEPGTPNLVGGSVREVAHALGDLAAGETASFEVSAIAERLTILVATVAATTSSLDQDYSDNTAVSVLNVGFESTPNSLRVVEIPTADVKVHPVTGNLVIATTSDATSGIADSLVILNPLNGRISQTIKLPGEAVKLAISEDGSTVYALGRARNLAYKVSLASNSVLDTLSFPGLSIDDLEVLRGTTDSIVLGSGWDGVRVYDNGVMRPNTSGTYNGDQVELLPDPSLVFGYNTEHSGFESFKFVIDSQGVQTQSASGGLFSGYSNDIKSDGYYVYSPYGKAVRADIMAVDGSFDLEAAFGTTSYYGLGIGGLEPERALQRVYFSRDNRIVSFDSQSYLKVRGITFENLPPRSIGRLERWGADGFAAILDNNHLAIIRSDIVPSEPGAIDFIVSPGDGAQVSQTPLQIVGKAFGGQGIQSISVNGQLILPASGYADWSTQVDLSSGANLLTFRITPLGGGATVTRNVTITYVAPIEAVLEEKARAALGTTNLPIGWQSSDQDGDGYSLRDEILLGMDHTNSDLPLLLHTLKTTAAGVRTFAYRRLKSLKEDYSLKISTDLNSWTDPDPALISVGSPATASDDPDYEDVYFQVELAQYPRLFYRLVVAQN